MFEKTEIRRTREKMMVEITLANGTVEKGDLFTARGERISDLLNDPRTFIPLDVGGDEVHVIAKSHIAQVKVVNEDPSDVGVTDPFAILRVQPEASDAEVRAAWMSRVKSCHPDRLAALNLDPDIVRAARNVSQRINTAYDTIVRARRDDRATDAA